MRQQIPGQSFKTSTHVTITTEKYFTIKQKIFRENNVIKSAMRSALGPGPLYSLRSFPLFGIKFAIEPSRTSEGSAFFKRKTRSFPAAATLNIPTAYFIEISVNSHSSRQK